VRDLQIKLSRAESFLPEGKVLISAATRMFFGACCTSQAARNYNRSTAMATAFPPPKHNAAMPLFALRRAIS